MPVMPVPISALQPVPIQRYHHLNEQGIVLFSELRKLNHDVSSFVLKKGLK